MPLRVKPDNRRTKRKDIAPCGMNCSLCYATMREKGNNCPGCRGGETNKTKSCIACRIRKCEKLKGDTEFCYSCDIFPCSRLKQLDARYRKNYGMSMRENLDQIRREGIRAFVRRENERWRCSSCGTTLCVHRPDCPCCGNPWGRYL